MKRSINQLYKWKIVNKKVFQFGGGHPPKTVQVEFNPENLTVYENDVTPKDLEEFRDMIPANRPQQLREISGIEKIFKMLIKNRIAVDFLSNNFVKSQDLQSSEYFNPPCLTDNSIFVCQSIELANQYKSTRNFDLFLTSSVLLLSPFSVYIGTMFAASYFMFANFSFYEPSRRIVVRMDILPHIESLSVFRIGFNGNLYNKIYKINALEKVNSKQIEDKEYMLYKATRPHFNMDLIFRDKESGDYLFFEKNTLWSQQGLEHPLIN